MKKTTLVLGLLGAFALAVILSSCPQTTAGQGPGEQPAATTLDFVGAEACRRCHSEVYEESQNTHHAQALADLATAHQDTNARCLQCHTVGWAYQQQQRQAGYVDAATTPHLANVQCENCHGPGRAHVEDPQANHPVRTLDAELCGQCHTGAHQPTTEEWRSSHHADSLETIVNNPHGQDSCLDCHSVDRFLAQPLPVSPQPQAAARNIFSEPPVAQFSITCVVCHDPHQNQFDPQLRVAARDGCVRCHTDGGATPGSTPRQPQLQVFSGVNGVDANGSELIGPNSGHTLAADPERCVTCHVQRIDVDQPTEDNPNFTGHTFLPDHLQVCVKPGCHTSIDQAQQWRDSVQAEVEARIAQVQALLNGVDRSSLSPADQSRYDRAKFDLDLANGDGSRGVHNHRYTEGLLDTAEGILQSL